MKIGNNRTSGGRNAAAVIFDRPYMVDTRKETRSQNSRTQDTVRQSDGREGEEWHERRECRRGAKPPMPRAPKADKLIAHIWSML